MIDDYKCENDYETYENDVLGAICAARWGGGMWNQRRWRGTGRDDDNDANDDDIGDDGDDDGDEDDDDNNDDIIKIFSRWQA